MAAPEMRDDPRFPGAKIHESAYVDDGVTIGAGSKVWHFVHVLGETAIGKDCVLGQNVMVGPRVTVGDNCKVQNNVALYDGVVLEDDVFCGPSCVFTNVNNPRAFLNRKSEFRRTLVRQGASIGANATIVCGHTLGAYCFIAAGAVVTRDVPDYALMAGVPARRIGWMSKAGERLGPDLTCPLTGTRYRETGSDHLEEIA
jgi:UDP-2-acetamido-3-amino-2,3-dideoxy-glucuronate N-acetyltransferase